MKEILRGFAICFSTYSRIPMPRVSWEGKNMRFVFAFFPLIGAVIGGAELGWFVLARHCGVPELFYAVVCAVIPLLITGGIHLDGWMDSCDAIFSYADRSKRLEIMKDPHIGAFGAIGLAVYLLLQVGLFSWLYRDGTISNALFLALGYLVSRSICGLSVVSLPAAKQSGLAYLFQTGADRRLSMVFLVIWLVAAFSASAVISLSGAAITAAGIALLSAVYLPYIIKQFGGINGDLAGGFLQLSELLILSFGLLPIF